MSFRLGWCVLGGVVAVLLPAQAAFGQVAAPLQMKINKAVDDGLDYLRRQQRKDGSWSYKFSVYNVGVTSLAGWTLAANVPANKRPLADKNIAKAAEYVRKNVINDKKTYNVALAIFFLSFLRDVEDAPLIALLADRLARSQNPQTGSWSYDCAMLPDNVMANVLPLVNLRNGKFNPTEVTKPADLPAVIQQRVQLLKGQVRQVTTRSAIGGDNSNTQFAMMALWVARRYGAVHDANLVAVEEHFRKTQRKDGFWGYTGSKRAPENTHAMTCAGLLALKLGQELLPKGGALMNDVQVARGFDRLFSSLDNRQTKDDKRFYYFLWSVERVGVAYNIKNVKGTDWYDYGVDFLLPRQAKNGSWADANSEFPGVTDTSFAVLFLRKVDVAKIPVRRGLAPIGLPPPPRAPVIEVAPGIIDLEDTRPEQG
jgi:hypothetical protein